MIDRRHFIRLAALMGGGALTGALLTRAQAAAATAGPPPLTDPTAWFLKDPPPLVEAPAYVHWPIDTVEQNWHQDFETQVMELRIHWRGYDETLAPDERPMYFALSGAMLRSDVVDRTERARIAILSWNRALENIRRMHGFPVEMIHGACRRWPQPRWRRTVDGAWTVVPPGMKRVDPTLLGLG